MTERRTATTDRFLAGFELTSLTENSLSDFERRSPGRQLPYLVLPPGITVAVSAQLNRIIPASQYDELSLGLIRLDHPIEVILFSAGRAPEQIQWDATFIPSSKEIAETLAQERQVRETPYHNVAERVDLERHAYSMVAKVSAGIIRRSRLLQVRLGAADPNVTPRGVRQLRFNFRVPDAQLSSLFRRGLAR